MKRILLLCCFFISTLPITAQQYPDDIRKAKKINEAAMDYFGKMPEHATQSDIDYVLAKFKELNDALYMPYMLGNQVEKKLVTYYRTIFRFRLGYMYAGQNDPRNALRYYKEADMYMDSLLVKNAFPIDYWLGSEEYSINGSYFHGILPIMYLGMASLFSGRSHWEETENSYWEETEKYSRMALSCEGISNNNKLRATGLLIACLEKKEQEDKEILIQLLSFWKTLRKADTAVQRQMKFTDAEMLQKVKDLTDKVYAKEDDGSIPAMVAGALFELNKDEEAETFLKLAIQKKPNIGLPGFDDEFYYKAMMNAYKFKDKDVMAWTSLHLGTSYILPRMYVKDVVMILNYLGDREFARIVKKRYK